MARWIDQKAGQLADQTDALFAASEGNPLFVQELLAAATKIVPMIKALGYVWVACDLEGYRSGSMNEAL